MSGPARSRAAGREGSRQARARVSGAPGAAPRPALAVARRPHWAFLAGAVLTGALVAAAVIAGRVRRAELAASAPVRATGALPGAAGSGPPPADALVVLGASVYEHGPSGELRARLDHALALWRMGVAPVVMVSGGRTGELDEIDAMRAYLVAHGVPDDAVAAVRPSENTRTLLRTLAGRGDLRYVAVSSPYHALRIRAEARRLRLRVVVSAPPSTPETRDGPTYRARFATEVAAVVWYALPSSWSGRVRTGPGTMRHVAPRVLAGKSPPSALLYTRRRRPA